MNKKKLNKIANSLVESSKGILAADESTSTITKRFEQINLESNFENRRKYRELLFKTPELGSYISGVILFDETIKQSDRENTSFVKILKNQNIHPGIKVDVGAKPLLGSDIEKSTEGLDNLYNRVEEYSKLGATFAKWRAVITILNDFPSRYCIKINSDSLARYAKIVQSHSLVPIVEPEVLMDGTHSIDKCFEVTSRTLEFVFESLVEHDVYLGGILLKPNMIISGLDSNETNDPDLVSKKTLECLKRYVPEEVPGIVFLSGGQSNELATNNLDKMNKLKIGPWKLSFSYGRALQQPVLKKWNGKDQNSFEAQKELLKRAKLNFLAAKGEYEPDLE